MKHISVLIKPASSLCNLRCKYCFYANVSSLREVRSYGKMKESTTEKMIENIFFDLEDDDQLTLAFQGGEPTLAGLDYFEFVVSRIQATSKKVKVHYAIQTNGILINPKWCDFLKKNNFLVGLSIDGNPIHHDLNRIDTKGRGTFNKVIQAKKLFDEYGIEYNVLCVLTNPLAKEAKKVFQFLKSERIKYVQFIPCLDDLDVTSRSPHALTPKRFATFYNQILGFWLEELQNGNYISIKLFDDMVNLLVKHQVTACGIMGNCQVQYVIEADGSVYPCDFYMLDEYRMGYIQNETLRELFEKDIPREFICSRKVLPDYCATCPFLKVCNGGCKRMKDAMYVDEKTEYCGYQALLENFIPKINPILKALEKIKA